MKKIFLVILFVLITFFTSAQEIVKLTFAGDLMAHDVNYKTKPLNDIYKGVREELIDDDLSFINVEFPVDEDRKQSSYPSFNVHPSYIESAIESGFDVFSIANNHTNDFGYGSLVKTVNNMALFKKKYPIIYSGVYGTDETTFSIETIQVKGLKIGFLAVTQFSNNFWNKKGAKKIYTVDYFPDPEKPENPINVKKLETFIKSVADDYDCFILSYHGGREYKPGPNRYRREFFSKMIDAGVDIMWGHHPHVLQPWYQESRESGDKLVMYSMGNFVSGQLAIVDPEEHNINFAATGFSSLFKVGIKMEDGKLRILNTEPKMIANVRNENNYFVTVLKDVALEHPMSDEWKAFYQKMFPVAENRIREENL